MSDLVSPLVDYWHVNVVDEHGHFLACRRPVRRTHAFVNVTLYCTLQHIVHFTLHLHAAPFIQNNQPM